MPFNSIFSWLIQKRIRSIDFFKSHPIKIQANLLQKLITENKSTVFGINHSFSSIRTYEDFSTNVSLNDYETLFPFIDKELQGEKDVLTIGATKWFSKSSGTTSNRTKLIPVTKASLFNCHYKGGKDLLALYYTNYPKRKLYKGKHLILGGSAEINHINKNSYIGDLSAIIVKNLPWWAEIRRRAVPINESDVHLAIRMNKERLEQIWLEMYPGKKLPKDVFKSFRQIYQSIMKRRAPFVKAMQQKPLNKENY